MKIYEYQNQKNLCGQRVKERRKELRVTQTQLAARMQLNGVMLDQKAISRIELQDRIVTDYELWVLAKVLKTDMKQLLFGPIKKNEK